MTSTRTAPDFSGSALNRGKWHLIVNGESGGVLRNGDPDSVCAELKKALSNGARDPVKAEIVSGSDLETSIRDALAKQPDVLVIAGGDGTLSLASSMLRDSETALGVIPMGTMNLLARDLNIPLDPLEAAAELSRARIQKIDVAEVNGHPFVSSSVLGVVPRLAKHREDARSQPFWKAIPELIRAFSVVLASYQMRRLSLRSDTEWRTFKTPFLAVANNPFAEEFGTVPTHDRLDQGRLALYLSNSDQHWRTPFTLLGLLMGAWAWDPSLERLDGEHFRITTRRRKRFRVMNDGELLKLNSPLEYTINRRCLKVLAPNDQTSAEGDS